MLAAAGRRLKDEGLSVWFMPEGHRNAGPRAASVQDGRVPPRRRRGRPDRPRRRGAARSRIVDTGGWSRIGARSRISVLEAVSVPPVAVRRGSIARIGVGGAGDDAARARPAQVSASDRTGSPITLPLARARLRGDPSRFRLSDAVAQRCIGSARRRPAGGEKTRGRGDCRAARPRRPRTSAGSVGRTPKRRPEAVARTRALPRGRFRARRRRASCPGAAPSGAPSRALRAERHPDAELVEPLADRERDDAR